MDAEEAAAIAHRVFANEAGGDRRRLLWWNEGEAFPSLGIGHFIWYSAGYEGPFEESFPALLAFARAHGIEPPPWLAGVEDPDCPWPDRDSFEAARAHDSRMAALARWLERTVGAQALFLLARIESTLPAVIAEAPPALRPRVTARAAALAATSGGRFALVDYVNFKGSGLAARERYRGQGWGLAQVLAEMDNRACAVDAFAIAAARVLERRVRNSPPERRESRWLPGWRARVAAYRGGEGC